jgi:hypothetical protein
MNEKDLKEIERLVSQDGTTESRWIVTLVAEVRRLQAALEWYSDKSHYERGTGLGGQTAMNDDNGLVARMALRKGAE